MAKIIVFQHVPYEPLGTLDPLLRLHRHRIKYVNFGRDPHQQPSLDGYDALIVLGGPMNLGQEDEYPHLAYEQEAIRQAYDRNMPVLGICLGSQLIASALGGRVYPSNELEIGWVDVIKEEQAKTDPVFQHFADCQKVFQWHGYTFDLPPLATPLLSGKVCENQAFKVGDNIYGLQFHLEVNLKLIHRWLHLPAHQQELGLNSKQRIEDIWQETLYLADQSIDLSQRVFSEFISLIPGVKRQHIFVHRSFR